jgi:hypothetical protein
LGKNEQGTTSIFTVERREKRLGLGYKLKSEKTFWTQNDENEHGSISALFLWKTLNRISLSAWNLSRSSDTSTLSSILGEDYPIDYSEHRGGTKALFEGAESLAFNTPDQEPYVDRWDEEASVPEPPAQPKAEKPGPSTSKPRQPPTSRPEAPAQFEKRWAHNYKCDLIEKKQLYQIKVGTPVQGQLLSAPKRFYKRAEKQREWELKQAADEAERSTSSSTPPAQEHSIEEEATVLADVLAASRLTAIEETENR